jgi:transcriptional regulator with XRE-family HTH domain
MPNVIEVQQLLGVRIRERRRELGLTQGALALRAGLSRPSIANLEAGRQNAGLRQLVALARALEVDVAALFERTQERAGATPA